MKSRLKRKYVIYVLVIGLIVLVQSAFYADIPIDTVKQKYANAESEFIEVDGMQVHYRDEGEGIPILLIHGTASSLHTWNDWVDTLKYKYRIVRLDLPAFGLTGANINGDYSISSYTSFLNKFLNKINLDSCYMVGNSLGGNIAWNYAVDHPNQVKKLVLIDASGLPTNKAQPWIFKMAKTPVFNKLFLHFTPKVIIKKNLEEVYHDDTKISDTLVMRYHDMALRQGNRQAFIDRAKTDFRPSDSTNINRLKQLKTGTLIIWGANDEWIPLDNGKRMDSLITKSKLVIIKNSGHVPMEENPKESLELLLDFIEE